MDELAQGELGLRVDRGGPYCHVTQIIDNLPVLLTERSACRIVGQPRGTQRYVPTLKPDEDELTRNIVYLASEHGRYGYRRVTALLNDSGMVVGKDRVQRRAFVRHWSEDNGERHREGLNRRSAQRKSRRNSQNGHVCG